MASKLIYPLYNTTYTLHRLSPLHRFPALMSAPDLKQHAKSLLSILRGDVLRGVRVRAGDDDDDDALGRAGKLKGVVWEALSNQRRWRRERSQDGEEGEDDEGDSEPRGVVVEIIYEKASYTSLLLLPTAASRTAGTGEFTSLPLLLTRLPKSLRETLLNYLETTFDTLPLPLSLDSDALKKMLEKWLDVTLSSGDGAGKDIQLVFSAPPPGTSLKAITITIPRADVIGFFRRGKKLVAAGSTDEGAFFEALRHYAQGTMGLDISALSVMKVACGGFVLGVGASGVAGKVKMFAPREGEAVGEKAAEGLVNGLVEASLVAALR